MAGKDSKIPYVTASSWDVLAISGQVWTLARSRFGGAEGNRTPDLRIANATLSHLSYGPAPVRGGETRGPGKPGGTVRISPPARKADFTGAAVRASASTFPVDKRHACAHIEKSAAVPTSGIAAPVTTHAASARGVSKARPCSPCCS